MYLFYTQNQTKAIIIWSVLDHECIDCWNCMTLFTVAERAWTRCSLDMFYIPLTYKWNKQIIHWNLKYHTRIHKLIGFANLIHFCTYYNLWLSDIGFFPKKLSFVMELFVMYSRLAVLISLLQFGQCAIHFSAHSAKSLAEDFVSSTVSKTRTCKQYFNTFQEL